MIKLFSDAVKIPIRSLSKETTQMDLNKFSYWEDIWKQTLNIERYKVSHIEFKNIKIKYEGNQEGNLKIELRT